MGTLVRRTLLTTHAIEAHFSTALYIAGNVKRWQGGDHIARWSVAGLLEAQNKIHRVRGYSKFATLTRKSNPELHSQQQVA